MTRAPKTLLKALLGGAGTSLALATAIVAQDAWVVGGSALPPAAAGGTALPPAAAPAPAPAYQAPAPQGYAPPAYAPPVPAHSGGSYLPPAAAAPVRQASYGNPYAAPSGWAPPSSAGMARMAPPPAPREPIPAESRGYYPGRADKGQGTGMGLRGTHDVPFDTEHYAQVTGGTSLPPGLPPGAGGTSVPPTARPASRPQSWSERLGLGNVSAKIFGHAKGGAAARTEDTGGVDGSWEETFIADALLGGEVSAVTAGGLEYGARLELRGAHDPDSTLFGGLVGGCPLGTPGCAGQVVLGGETFALRGHTSQQFTGTLDGVDDSRVVLEGAHLFFNTAYGDVTLGRDVGTAEAFSLSAPTLLELGGNNGRADYTSLGVLTTANDPTGYSEKITYTSPRLGGDRIGVGLQFGASYAPDVDACGVYACFRRNGDDLAAGSLGAVLEDAVELGVSLDAKLLGGSVEVTGTYGRAGLDDAAVVGPAATLFDDLSSWGVGAEAEWDAPGGTLVLGGSYLDSNNALAGSRGYTAWDAGATYLVEGGALDGWGATLGYGRSDDENTDTTSDQYILGLSREFRDTFSLGFGLQYIERTSPFLQGGQVGGVEEKGTALFIEGGVEF